MQNKKKLFCLLTMFSTSMTTHQKLWPNWKLSRQKLFLFCASFGLYFILKSGQNSTNLVLVEWKIVSTTMQNGLKSLAEMFFFFQIVQLFCFFNKFVKHYFFCKKHQSLCIFDNNSFSCWLKKTKIKWKSRSWLTKKSNIFLTNNE